jgi:hypothetical protein
MSEYDELLDWLRRESEAVINNWPPNVTRVGPTEPGNIFEDAAAAIRKLTAERDAWVKRCDNWRHITDEREIMLKAAEARAAALEAAAQAAPAPEGKPAKT